MMNHEESFNKWKEETRRDALEKELSRMDSQQNQQQKTIQKLRTLLLISVAALLLSWIGFMLFTKEQENSHTPLQSSSSIHEEKLPDSLNTEHNKPLITKANLQILTPQADTVNFKIPDDGIFFSIQIGAYLGVDMTSFRPNMVSLYQESSAGINQFTLGVLPKYEQALEFKGIVRKIGFSDAYITAFQHGKRLTLQEALSFRLKNGNN